MARQRFGGGVADWDFDRNTSTGVVSTTGGKTLVFFSAETGGSQYTDLLDESDQPVDHITSSDGTDGRAVGAIPPFQGPDGIYVMWASSAGGPRQLMFSAEALQLLGPLTDALNATFGAHVAALNPHGTRTSDLTDVSTAAPVDGQVLMYESGSYAPTTVLGLDPQQFVSVEGGSQILIPEGNTNTVALQIRLPSGSRTGAVNTMSVWWNSGSSGTPTWVETFRVGPRGELILQPSAIDRVPLEIRQYSGSQTANLTAWATSAGVPISYVDSAGRVRAPNVAITPVWSIDTATVTAGTFRWYNTTGTTLQLRGFALSAGGNAPTGADLIVNPRLDGTAIYTSGNRPRIAAGQRYSGLATSMATTAWPSASYLTVDVDQVGSSVAGTKITIQGIAY